MNITKSISGISAVLVAFMLSGCVSTYDSGVKTVVTPRPSYGPSYVSGHPAPPPVVAVNPTPYPRPDVRNPHVSYTTTTTVRPAGSQAYSTSYSHSVTVTPVTPARPATPPPPPASSARPSQPAPAASNNQVNPNVVYQTSSTAGSNQAVSNNAVSRPSSASNQSNVAVSRPSSSGSAGVTVSRPSDSNSSPSVSRPSTNNNSQRSCTRDSDCSSGERCIMNQNVRANNGHNVGYCGR